MGFSKQNATSLPRRALAFGSIVFLSFALVVAGFGQRNVTGLRDLFAANCGALEAVFSEDFESRAQPVLDPWSDELKRAPNAYRVIADSPPALSGRWFEQITGKFENGAKPHADFLMKVNIPLTGETRLTAALRSVNGMAVNLSAVVRSKNGQTRLFMPALQNPADFGALLTANRNWEVKGSEDIYTLAYRWMIMTGQPVEGASIVAVGISFDGAEFDVNVDDLTVWRAKSCAPEKVPPIADLCEESYFVNTIQDFEDISAPALNDNNTQNAKIILAHQIEAGGALFAGQKYERLKFTYESAPKNDMDQWTMPLVVLLSSETHFSFAFQSANSRPVLIARVDFGGGKVGEMYARGDTLQPLTQNEQRNMAEAAKQGWQISVSPDIRAWAQDMAKKQNWNAAPPKLVAVGIDAGTLRNIDLKLDNFIVYFKTPDICKQFKK